MIDKIILTGGLLILILPIGLSVTVGYNRLAKFGLLLVVVGFACIYYSQHMLHDNAVYKLITEDYGKTAGTNRVYLNLWIGGIGVIVCGGGALFMGSVIRVWQKRKVLFPFLFKQ